MPPPNLVTIPRAAKLTGVPQRTIYNWVRIRRAQCWTVAEEIRLVDVDQLLALKRQRETGYIAPRQREPVNYRALETAAVEWDTVAAVQWCAGRDELGAAYAVCAFFAWLEVLGAERARDAHAEQKDVDA